MAKVVVALLDHNVQEGKNLQAYLQEKPDIVWKGWYLDVPQMEKALKRQRPDAIVVSMQDTERDAQMLLALSKADLANKYLLYTSQTDKKWHQQCRDLPIGFVVYKQTPMEVLYQRLLMVAKAAGGTGDGVSPPSTCKNCKARGGHGAQTYRRGSKALWVSLSMPGCGTGFGTSRLDG